MIIFGFLAGNAQAAILYASDNLNSVIDEFSPAGTSSIFASFGAAANPNGVAVDTGGNVYVADTAGNQIIKFTPGGVGSVFANTGLVNPSALAFDSLGNLYVANDSPFANPNDYIEKFTPSGIGSLFASGLSHPLDIAFDSAGNAYVADSGPGTVDKITSAGVVSVFVANTPGFAPTRLAIDGAGNIFVAVGLYGGSIYEFTPGGSQSVFATLPISSFPGPLAFDIGGNLYVVSRGSTTEIDAFTPGGSETLFANFGFPSAPEYIAFSPASPVPEPQIWTMLVTGSAVLVMLRTLGDGIGKRQFGRGNRQNRGGSHRSNNQTDYM